MPISKERQAKDQAWKAEHTLRMTFRFQKSTDADVIEFLQNQQSKLGTIKRLIREEIKRQNAGE